MRESSTSPSQWYDFRDALLYSKKKKIHTLKQCLCGNDTYSDSGVCVVCQVESRFLGGCDLLSMKQHSRFKKSLHGTDLKLLLAIKGYC